MAVNVQKPHEMSALIDTQPRKLRTQLLGAMVRREAGEPPPQRLHLRRSVEPEEAAERGRVSFLEMLGPLDAEQRTAGDEPRARPDIEQHAIGHRLAARAARITRPSGSGSCGSQNRLRLALIPSPVAIRRRWPLIRTATSARCMGKP